MGIKSLLKKRGVFVSWLISYFLILLIPVLVGFGIYFAAANIIENEINAANASTLKHLQEGIDGKLSEVKQLSLHIALNPRIQKQLYEQYSYASEYQYEIYQIINDFSTYYVLNDFIDNFFIYLKNSDIILSPNGKYDIETFYENTFQSDDLPINMWRTLIEEQSNGKYLPAKKLNPSGLEYDVIIYMLSLPLGNQKESLATVSVVINKGMIQDVVKKGKWINQGSIFILDENNSLVSSGEKTDDPYYFEINKMNGSGGSFHDKMNNADVVVSYIKSEECSWKYVSVIPTKIYMEKAQKIKVLTLISLLLCLVIGVYLSYFLAKRNYNPINELVKALSQKTSYTKQNACNEYRFIREAVNNTIREKEETDIKLKQQNTILKSVFISKMLKGRLNSESLTKEILDTFNIRFLSNEFAVILFSIENYSKLFRNDDRLPDEEKLKLLHFIISNISEEMCEQSGSTLIAEIDEMLACLINFKNEGGSGNRKKIMTISSEIQRFLSEKFQIYTTVSISSIQKSVENISTAYNEAFEAMQYKMTRNCNTIINYEDVKNTRHNYDYTLEAECQLINFIKTGDFQKSKLILDEVFEKNFNDKSISIQMARCLLFDLMSTIIKTLNSISTNSRTTLFEQMNPAKLFLNCKTADEMKNEMTGMLREICNYIGKSKKSHNDTLTENIIDFVEHNYQDINLSVALIADKFEINPEYLSRFFKEQTGSGLLDFINKLRLEKAKYLLKEAGLSIEDTADKVGYSNSSALIRVFKRYEGITPGQYKKLQQ